MQYWKLRKEKIFLFRSNFWNLIQFNIIEWNEKYFFRECNINIVKLTYISGHIPWWHQLEGNLLLIVIVAAVVLILVIIIICVIIFIVCRRKRNQMKCKLHFISNVIIVIVICCSQRFAWRSPFNGIFFKIMTFYKII